MLKINSCTKKFKKTRALDGFTVNIDSGVHGLLGPNGAGKTTLMRCICDIYKMDSGTIEKGFAEIGYLPQKFGMFKELTVYEMMQYFCTLKFIEKSKQKEQIHQCIEEVNLTEKIKDRISTLSGGMVRRLGIAQAILGDPQIILFDEPTAGLDPEERMRFKNIISRIKGNRTVIISTHIVSDVEAVCDDIIIMNKGKLITSGTPKEISGLAQNKVYSLNISDENKLAGDFYIKDRTLDNNVEKLLVLSAEKQAGELLIPTVEDGFLCALKNI